MSRQAKIVRALGPISSSPDRVRSLVDAGMDVARMCLPHGSHDDHRTRVLRLGRRRVCRASGSRTAGPCRRPGEQLAPAGGLSIEERDRSKNGYLRLFDRAADELVRHGYLVPQDADPMVAQAEALDIGLDDRP